MKRVRRTLPGLALLGLLLSAGGALGRQEEESPDARFIRAARASLASGKAAAAARLAEVRQTVAAELREENERDLRLARALKESTARVPLRVALDKNVILDNVRVSAYAAGVVTLTWPQGEVPYPLAQLSEEARGALVGIALSKGSSRDSFELGKILLRGKDYDGAGRCFASAVRLDPALAPAVPDVERLKRASRLFEGAFKLTGSTLSLRWGFSSAAEAGDFQALQGSVAVRPGAGLEFYAPKRALTAVREIPFRDHVRLSVLPKETESAAHLMGIRFTKPDGGAVLIYGALATTFKTFMVVRVEDDRAQELLAPTPGATGNRMTMEFSRGRVSFQVGDKTVWTGAEGGFSDVLAVLGAVALDKGTGSSGASALVKDVSLLGEVNPLWVTKKTAGLRDAFTSEFSKEFRARKGNAAAAGPSLSVDPALTEIPPLLRDYYRSALSKVAALRKSQLQEDLDSALAAMEELTRVDVAFPPAWYYRGAMEEQEGNYRGAAESYERALALLPEFPEALCGRGRVRAMAGDWPAARESADRAFALKPDLAEVHLLRARLHWESRESASVVDETQTARGLAPSDPEVQTSAQQLANVARGPRWTKPAAYESAHYSVRSDLPEARCREYAEHLEALRPHYEEVLGRPLPAGEKADILIFESEEGYFIYNDYTVGRRQEHTLGAFSPWHAQMALFEGVDVQQTCRVLAHEGFHQAIHSLATDVPTWLNEGMAEYVGAARVDKGRVVERGGLQEGRLENLTSAVKYGWQPLPFEDLLQETQAEFYSAQAPLKYAQAWSMVRYFMDGESGRWKPLLRDYLGRVLAGDSQREAFEATFAKQNLAELQAGWLKHVGLVPKQRPVPKEAPAAPAEPATPAGPPVDLLARLAAAGTPPRSGWTLTENLLESTRFGASSLDLGYEPPEEYDWRLTIRRTGGEGPLLLGLQAGESSFLLRLDDRGASRIEAVDGLDFANAPARTRAVLPVGKAVSLVCSVRKTGVSIAVGRESLLDWKGDLKRLTYIPEGEMPPATKALFLYAKEVAFQITAMGVDPLGASGPAASAPSTKAPPPAVAFDPTRAIPLDAEPRRWIADEEGRQILILDAAGNLQLVSLSERKVLRTVAAGAGASCLAPVPGGLRSVWVGAPKAGSLLRIDLEKGEIAEAIPTAYAPDGLAVFRRIAYCVVPSSGLYGVDLGEKKDLGNVGGNYYSALAYEVRKDRLWGLSSGFLIEFDGSKVGPTLKELARKSAGGKERADLVNALAALGKRHPIGGLDIAQLGPRILLDERSGRIYVSAAAVKTDKPELTLGVFRAPNHSLEKDPAVREFTGKILGRDQILAASPDGKWAASGSHLYNAATFAVRQELPLPTSLVGFSKDSKELYYYDWVHHALAAMDLEAK